MSLDAAVKNAVDECIQKGILADFLRVNRAEVIAMSIFEYDKEEEEQKLQVTYEKQGELKKAKSILLLPLSSIMRYFIRLKNSSQRALKLLICPYTKTASLKQKTSKTQSGTIHALLL